MELNKTVDVSEDALNVLEKWKVELSQIGNFYLKEAGIKAACLYYL